MSTDFERISNKYHSLDLKMKDGMDALTRIFNQRPSEYHSMNEHSDDPLLDALLILGTKHHLPIVHPLVAPHKASGYSLDEIVEASHIRYREISLRGKWYKEDAGPFLAFMKDTGKPVALVHLRPKEYQLIDPATGQGVVVSKSIAEEIASVAYMFYQPFENKPLGIKDLMTYSMKASWTIDIWRILLMSLAGGLITLTIPIFSGYLFDTLVPGGDHIGIFQLLAVVITALLAGGVFQGIKSISLTRIEASMELNLQAAVWDRLLGLPVDFFRRFTAGDLTNRALGIGKIRRILSSVIVTGVISGVFSFINVGLLFYYSVELGFVALLLVLTYLVISFVIGQKQMKFERAAIKMNAKNTGALYELLNGALKFKMTSSEAQAFSMWSHGFSKEMKEHMASMKLRKIANLVSSFFGLLSFSFLYYYMIHHFQGGMTTGIFIGFITAFSMFQMAMTSLVRSVIMGTTVLPLYENAKPILDQTLEYDVQKSHPGVLSGDIEVKHVKFRYESHQALILDDVSLKIEAGSYVALVGSSGSGKSTLVRLLLGFEHAEHGNIYYGHDEINDVDIRAVRKQLGVVLQDGALLSGSIGSNIICGNPEVTLEKAWEAAKMAGIDADIKDMPMGMDTVVSEGTSTISGGQRQRILIARAIANKPRILFFDEATSALDNKTQAEVQKSLDGLETTRIVIAHRLSTIKHCDHIYVLDKGHIVEEGNFDELMSMNGLFKEIATRQMA